MEQDKFLQSVRAIGVDFFSMMIAFSPFQSPGQFLFFIERLYITVNGMARRSEKSVTNFGIISPTSVDSGFLKDLRAAAT